MSIDFRKIDEYYGFKSYEADQCGGLMCKKFEKAARKDIKNMSKLARDNYKKISSRKNPDFYIYKDTYGFFDEKCFFIRGYKPDLDRFQLDVYEVEKYLENYEVDDLFFDDNDFECPMYKIMYSQEKNIKLLFKALLSIICDWDASDEEVLNEVRYFCKDKVSSWEDNYKPEKDLCYVDIRDIYDWIYDKYKNDIFDITKKK